MAQDIVFAIRLFRRHLGLFGITVAGLAVSIGITTAALSVAARRASQMNPAQLLKLG